MDIEIIYVIIIVIITVIIFIMYSYTIKQHNKEITKIIMLENLEREKEQKKNYARVLSKQCDIGNFTNPRSCYFNSGKRCSWNLLADRCDLRS